MRTTNPDSIGGDRQPSDAAECKIAIDELLKLEAGTLQRQWRALVGGALPSRLGRQLVLRILAYKLQAQRLGDLDAASQRELSVTLKSHRRQAHSVRSVLLSDDETSHPNGIGEHKDRATRPATDRIARPGSLLMREHAGVLHRVMVLDQGVTWNGKTYESLSQVAFAITGTRWNGPRFFGLRDKPMKADESERPHVIKSASTSSAPVKRRFSRPERSSGQRAVP